MLSASLNAQGRLVLYGDSAYFDSGVYATPRSSAMQRAWIAGRLDLIGDYIEPAGSRIFEAGCAYGMFLAEARRRGFEVAGLEFSPVAAETASRLLEIEVIRGEVVDLDRDDDFLSGVLRSISNQGNAAENLQLHFVDTEEAGIRLVEKRKASAFVVLPENLTDDLLEGTATSIALYKNPAETILPKIVEEGLNIVCIGVSQALSLLQPEIKSIRKMFDQDRMPEPIEVASVASSSVQRLRTVEPYLFPPLIQFETINASDYVQSTNQNQEKIEDPNQ